MDEPDDAPIVAPTPAADPPPSALAAEGRLRDHLARRLALIEPGLALAVDDEGMEGVDYATPVGRIGLLAVDGQGRYAVIEVVADGEPDVHLARALRCRGWVRQHLAGGREVRSLLLVERVTEELRYLLAEVRNVELFAYEVAVAVRKVAV